MKYKRGLLDSNTVKATIQQNLHNKQVNTPTSAIAPFSEELDFTNLGQIAEQVYFERDLVQETLEQEIAVLEQRLDIIQRLRDAEKPLKSRVKILKSSLKQLKDIQFSLLKGEETETLEYLQISTKSTTMETVVEEANSLSDFAK